MGAFRILVADDHPIFRVGLCSLLASHEGWEVCGEAETGREAVEKASQLKPDVVVLDYSMPGLNGAEATRQIIQRVPRAEVLILTMHSSEDLIRGALEAGARAYVLKSDAGRDLISAVHALVEHKAFLSSGASGPVLDSYLRGAQPSASQHSLTPREREILQLVAEGRSNKEIATTLTISTKTVETHRANLMHKLGLTSVGALVRYAVRNQIIEP